MKLMKTIRLIFCLVCSIALFSCSKNDDTVSSVNKGIELTIKAYQENSTDETRTILQEDGKVFWTPGDAISVFYKEGTDGGSKFVAQNAEVAEITEFKGTLNNFTGGGEDLSNESYFWGIYPYSSDNQCGDNSVTINVASKQNALEGTFAKNMFPTVARSKGLELAFYNICGGVKFSVSQPGIRSICFKANNNETIAGKVKVEFGADGKPVVSEVLDGSDEVTIYAPNGGSFEVGKYYYIVLLPTRLTEGFTLLLKNSNSQEGKIQTSKTITVKRSTFGVLNRIDSGVTSWESVSGSGGGTETGIYLGIMGFNETIYPYPITILNENNAGAAIGFISGLTAKGYTLLYYTFDKAIDELQGAIFPSNLYNVSMVTFTDGFDEGSIMTTDKYLQEEEYLQDLNCRIKNETVSSINIDSYTIGFAGNVKDYNRPLFSDILRQMSNPEDNAIEIDEIEELYSAFEDIAKEISQTFYLQDLELTMIGKGDGTKFRWTFDDVKDAKDSKLYIEGTFDLRNRSLYDVVYCGMTSTSGSEVQNVRIHGSKIDFVFENLKRTNNELLPQDNIEQWYYLSQTGRWQASDEMEDEAEKPKIRKTMQSVAIMMLLDCSNSLVGNDDFSTLQDAAAKFIEILMESAIDINAVASVTLDKYEETMDIGSTIKLNATVLPDTALDKDIIWSSSNPTVASVDQNGNVTAHSVGTARIYAESKSESQSASCLISVVKLAETVGLSTSELSLYTGETATLSATVSPENTSDKSIEWKSSAPSIAKVDQNGTITAIKAGTATITARAADGSEKEASCTVTVKQHVTGVSVDPQELSLITGDKAIIKAIITPADATDKSIIWSSSDKNIATVDSNGEVTALKAGNAEIYAVTNDGGKKAICRIGIRQLSEGITIEPEEIEIYTGETSQLNATLFPENTSDKTLKWESSNTSIVTVDQTGLIRAIKAGSATISVTSTDGGNHSATCTVTVKQHVTSVSISPSSLSLHNGQTSTLNATVLPSDATDKTLSWKSSDVSVATVDDSGNVTGIGRGRTTVTATSRDGELESKCEVEVRQLAEEISIDESDVTLYTGESAELSATVLPEDTSDKTVQWSSSNTAVATVDQNGIITAIKAGTATIKATSTDGSNVSASCTVTVLQHVNGIAFSSPSLNLPIDETLVLKPEFLPADASNRQVIWEVADENILQIDDSGKLTPLSLGTTTVTATTVEGGYSASCEITVTLSTTLKDLSLAVTKDGNRYFVTQEEYDSYDLGEYTAEGVAINYSNQKFIIEIGELSSSDFSSSETGGTEATASRSAPSIIRPIIPGGGIVATITYTFSFEDANRLNNLPSYNQAQVICNRLTQINDAAEGFGLYSLISTTKKYWTSHKYYNSSFWYMYNGSLESTSSSSSKFYAKPVITL